MNDPDRARLAKALTVEAENGYQDLQGNRYRFSEFLCLNFGASPPAGIPIDDRIRWRSLGVRYAKYDRLDIEQRRVLVEETRNFLHKIQNPPATQPESLTVTPANPSRKVSLHSPLRELADVGYRRANLLEKLGLYRVEDLLYYYPRDHIDYTRQVKIKELTDGETVTLIGRVKRCNCFTSPKNPKLAIFELVLEDSTGNIKLNRFLAGNRYTNRGWQEGQKQMYPAGSIVAASGLVKKTKYGLNLDNPEFEVLEGSGGKVESLKIGRILPVYPLTEGLAADAIRKAVIEAFGAIDLISDPLPIGLKKQYGLIDLKKAIANIHFPDKPETLGAARRRLVFDEFFYLQLGFLRRRQQYRQTTKSAAFNPRGALIDKFNKIIPFSLTEAQKRVIEEILNDLDSNRPMNRLVQGDVGSGKTIVGVYAILAALQSGYQAALMAPTEVLAEQHYKKLVGWFNLLHLPVELLTGSTKTAKRREIHAQLESGELPLLVGTHALIQDPVNFRRLGLVVIDEQHRFGVQQRARLLSKGESPHVLTMTATPIPRTLALTLHGDLDVSQIDELPPGRQPIETTALTGKQRMEAYELIRREVAKGRQAYVIFPMIEESEKLDVKAAVEEHQNLSEKIFPNFNIGLLHGKMGSAQKEEVLQAFRDNRIQIIVSTTVIEVGVDVPNATVMLIENAERFGLSQLHQLRGRVGRGSHKSYCLLLSGSNTANARQRLSVLEQSRDGFFISEMDMRFRGPGEVLGQRQSGLPDFALASLVEDQEVLNLAREAAEKIMLDDPHLITLPNLKKALEAKYERMLGSDILT